MKFNTKFIIRLTFIITVILLSVQLAKAEAAARTIASSPKYIPVDSTIYDGLSDFMKKVNDLILTGKFEEIAGLQPDISVLKTLYPETNGLTLNETELLTLLNRPFELMQKAAQIYTSYLFQKGKADVIISQAGIIRTKADTSLFSRTGYILLPMISITLGRIRNNDARSRIELYYDAAVLLKDGKMYLLDLLVDTANVKLTLPKTEEVKKPAKKKLKNDPQKGGATGSVPQSRVNIPETITYNGQNLKSDDINLLTKKAAAGKETIGSKSKQTILSEKNLLFKELLKDKFTLLKKK